MCVGYSSDGNHFTIRPPTPTLPDKHIYMKATLALPRRPKKAIDAAVFEHEIGGKKGDIFSFLDTLDALKSTRKPYFKFYKVFKNGTAVTEVSTNDFKSFDAVLLKIKTACGLHALGCPAFSIRNDDHFFYGFLCRVTAMKRAKTGALAYIGKLIEDGERSGHLLLRYREDHYEDLNFNLTDRSIRNIELALAAGNYRICR
jgi:hypothetical protein